MGRAFGIEIECYAPTQGDATVATADLLTVAGINIRAQYSHHGFSRRQWTAKHDGSLSTSRGGVEVVSPPLKDARGREEVKKVADTLLAAGYTVDRSCGIHVHVDCTDLNESERAAVAWRFAEFQDPIYRNVPAHRLTSNYTAPVRPMEKNDLWRAVAAGTSNGAANAMHSRYKGINTQSLRDKHTIELRLHEGCLDSDRLTKWIQFCVFFVNETVAKMRADAGESVTQVERHQPNPYRSGTKNWQCLEAVRSRPHTAEELAALTGWQVATISSMMSDIRHHGINVNRTGRGTQASFFAPGQMENVRTTVITQTELRGLITDGIPDGAAWFSTTSTI